MNRRDWIFAATATGLTCFARPVLAQSKPTTAKTSSHGCINLSMNENQFGPSPKALAAISEAQAYAHEYPLEAQARLKEAIARREQVDPSQVVLGAGSSDITMGLANTFGLGGGNIISSDPTFAILMGWAQKFGVEHIKVPWTKDHQTDLAGIEASINDDTKIVYICNPENPVGTVVDPQVLRAFCERVSKKALVLVDEAYLDYAGDADEIGMMSCVRDGLNVIVLRTFSKAYGLGGMRVGYAVMSPEKAAELEQFYVTGIGCGCSQTSLEAATAAYLDQDYLAKTRERNAASRDFLCDFLASKGLAYIPSHATFVLVPIETDSKKVADALFGAFNVKISPRSYFGKNYLRISMGRPDQMQTLVDGLKLLI